MELWLEEHTRNVIQGIPFFLCGLGIAAILLAMTRTQRWTLQILRIAMILVCAGSLFGIYQHFQHNLGFELGMRPNAVVSDVLIPALRGASPMLAPGNLALAGILGIAGTYRHPKLSKNDERA